MFKVAKWDDQDDGGKELLISGLFSPLQSGASQPAKKNKKKRNRQKKPEQSVGVTSSTDNRHADGGLGDGPLSGNTKPAISSGKKKKTEKRKRDEGSCEAVTPVERSSVGADAGTDAGADDGAGADAPQRKRKKKSVVHVTNKTEERMDSQSTSKMTANQTNSKSKTNAAEVGTGVKAQTGKPAPTSNQPQQQHREQQQKQQRQQQKQQQQKGQQQPQQQQQQLRKQQQQQQQQRKQQLQQQQQQRDRTLDQAKKGKKMTLQEKLRAKLDSGRFRYVNEQLYTSTSTQAVSLFKKEPKLFDIYHDGFATQVSKWPVNPVDVIVTWLSNKPASFVVADLGCGEAKLARTVAQKVHSFDLVAANEHVIACDMAHVPLKAMSVDVVVFCLSLMGTNLDDFVKEARRILRPRGILKVAEVKSRIDDIEDFTDAICEHGFEVIDNDVENKMFVDIEFHMVDAPESQYGQLSLKPCLYKRR